MDNSVSFRGFGISAAATAVKIMGDESNFHLSALVQIFCHNPFAILPRLIYTGPNPGPKERDESFATDCPGIRIYPAARKRKRRIKKKKKKEEDEN